MSAGAVPAPGTQYGPCDGDPECAHRDCDASRRTARAICSSCQFAIGYETPYFINLDRPEVPDGSGACPVHLPKDGPMSTWTRRWISCDADLCEDVFWGRPGRASSELAEELRSRARAEGWKHRQGGIDLCPAHREVET